MRCGYCDFEDSKVLDSRPVDNGSTIRRRRECLNCGKRFTTYERIEQVALVVVKTDNRRELFDGNKILNGLIKACDKRPIPILDLEEVVADIERELRATGEHEVSSRLIGEMIMTRLKELDQVAYVRFASVYRKFDDVETFMDEIRKILNDK